MTSIDLEVYRNRLMQEMMHFMSASSDAYSPTLEEAMRYSFLIEGKLLRPLLVLSIPIDLKRDYSSLLAPAVALEMVHCYSLIHDDLPCMDDDDYRRGQLSCHKVYGEATALLGGSALLVKAFEILGEASFSEGQKIKMLVELAKAVGSEGMIAGQALEIESDQKTVDLSKINHLKTGKLFLCAIEFGLIACAVEPSVANNLRLAIKIAGELFQLVDDVLDEESTQEDSEAVIQAGYQRAIDALSETHLEWPMLSALITQMCFRKQ